MKKMLAIATVLFLLAGCSSWKQVGGKEGYAFQSFRVDIPSDWMRLDTDRYMLLSKDGPFLQYILLQQFPLERPFQNTKKCFRVGMLPQEAAQVVIDDMNSDRALRNFHLLQSEPAHLQNLDGFRLLFTYENPDGLVYKTIYYGFMTGDMFYSVRYNAAARHYFEKDLGAFQHILSSFRIFKEMPV